MNLEFDGEYENVPEHLREGLRGWVETARPPGGFLTSVLENNLKEAVGRADEKSVAGLKYVVMWLFNRAPAGCWGSPGRVAAWAEEMAKR